MSVQREITMYISVSPYAQSIIDPHVSSDMKSFLIIVIDNCCHYFGKPYYSCIVLCCRWVDAFSFSFDYTFHFTLVCCVTSPTSMMVTEMPCLVFNGLCFALTWLGLFVHPCR